MLCAKGYKIEKGVCNKIICKDRQFSASGNCVNVSPFCQTYDSIYGNCLTCIQFYFLQTDGSCVQGISSQIGSSQKSTNSNSNIDCPDGYYSRSGTCVQVSPTCGTYDSTNGRCTTCVDDSYFLNKTTGACLLLSSLCGYRNYFNGNTCQKVSDLCDQFSTTTGECLSCRDNALLSDNGKCVYKIKCGDRQYHGADGSCTKVSDKCGDYDENSGQCLSCVKNYELNTGGYCCYSFNYMIDPQCVQFFSQNCVNQRPQFHNCLKCQVGYTLSNGVFGRCNQLTSNTTSN